MKKELKSIIARDIEHCLISGSPDPEVHHALEGVGKRRLSDDDGLIVGLSKQLHTEGKKPDVGVRCDVHHCRNMAYLMHVIGELAWEKQYIIEQRGLPFDTIEEEAHEAFRARYGKCFT